jgi:malate synthase
LAQGDPRRPNKVDAMTDLFRRAGLDVAQPLAQFIETQVLPGTGIEPARFWQGYAALLARFQPENRRLLARRAELQSAIDAWHVARRGEAWDAAAYRAFLTEIGYLVPVPAPFQIETGASDPEISTVAGPQLVVPVSNARFALNAANARWGSLYDALYGSDALGTPPPSGKGLDPARRDQVVAWAARFLDETFPLAAGSHANAAAYLVRDGALLAVVEGAETPLADPAAFLGTRGASDKRGYVLRHHGLHVELAFDPADPVGAASPSGLRDVILEAALTAIEDCEDSVAAVDVADKIGVYANWLGLMKGDLSESFEKGGRTLTRSLAPDRTVVTAEGEVTLPGRALLLVRNVGLLMTTDAVLSDGAETPEGLMDAMVTIACALHDLKKTAGPRNSRAGSIYVVKPKMHGPEEAAFADETFTAVEEIFGLAPNTVKLGLMDEERRTSANLAACIHALRRRIVFINTGFLDRTGDEIHTSMQAGAAVPRDAMKTAAWLPAYEDGNVVTGLACGFLGRGQIGKGMWAKPDAMAEMLEAKIAQPMSGATTAWVPSPTAATLHATHYHKVDVAERQRARAAEPLPLLDALLTPPIAIAPNSRDAVLRELDNSAQGILGYVVRWVDQGIGCSKVPDIDDVALMEDRATCRISAQYLANWLVQGVVTEAEVEDALRRMAAKVDGQNAGDPAYIPMAPAFDGPAFRAARDLVLEGASQPSGYTEPLLHARRREAKALRG